MEIRETHTFHFEFKVQNMPFKFDIDAQSEKGAVEVLKAVFVQIGAELAAGKGVVIAPNEPGEPGK